MSNSLQTNPTERRGRLVLDPKAYKALCKAVRQRDGWRCTVCRRRNNLHVHHIVHRSQGGDDASYNLLTVCFTCHDEIHNKRIFIRPLRDGEPINADEGVRVQFKEQTV